MPFGPDPARARAALARLQSLREVATAGEDDILASLVITGEPVPQRRFDDWLDQVADTLRAISETVDDLAPVLARHAVHPNPPHPPGPGPASPAPHSTSPADQ
ncbi:MAG: hypothetical protein ACRCYX_01770 [Dermatophilaceae bacterium]